MNKYVDFRSLPVLENSRLRPIVQYIESEDAMLARVSRFVPDCLYSAHVEGAKESSIVNLCDVHGGLVSSFILNSIMNFFFLGYFDYATQIYKRRKATRIAL